MKKHETIRSEKFRIPWTAEKKLELWVDRIGMAAEQKNTAPKLRILGLYAAVCCTAGQGYYYSEENGRIEVENGDVMVVFPDIAHFYQPVDQWGQQWIVWGGAEAARLEELGFLNRRNPVIRQSSALVTEAYSRLKSLIAAEDAASALERKIILLRMIAALADKAGGGPRSPTEKAVEKIRNLIDRNPEQEISVTGLATAAGVCEMHFRRLFKAATGRTPVEYVIMRRISLAKEYLSRGVSIKETAALTGFNNLFYFMRTFKKMTGVTPGEFQK
ncbi:MAG: HTH-type transcriptional activator Btr [Lentisphaerae bacterium ADurb.Bin242]|nr:MAG: HTH-type transcriptional activator Btr [Lentisphaerae bacterium ADurb.Bin242]